jgi:hypothetical protein
METECLRIADQLRRAFEGKAWHGPALKELMADVTAEQAQARSVASAHSIWELVSHIEVWTRAATEAAQDVPMPKIVGTAEDWPHATSCSSQAWNQTVGRMLETGESLARAIGQFGDGRLAETVPGRQYDFYYLFHGVIQHSLYHAGQIALLKKNMAPG